MKSNDPTGKNVPKAGDPPAFQTANEMVRDASIARRVWLIQFANGLARKVLELFTRADAELFSALAIALERLPPTSPDVRVIESTLSGVSRINAAIYARVQQSMETDLRALTLSELGFQGSMLEKVILPLRIPLTGAPAEQVYAAVLARPFQGRLLKEWSASNEATRMVRIRDTVRMGYLNSDPTAEIVKKIRGTRVNNYKDGLIEIDRRNAEAVVRTAVSHTASVARNKLYEANPDLITAVQWLATLDDRTSATCAARDGLKYSADSHIGIGCGFQRSWTPVSG
jgi:hypothetical protein